MKTIIKRCLTVLTVILFFSFTAYAQSNNFFTFKNSKLSAYSKWTGLQRHLNKIKR